MNCINIDLNQISSKFYIKYVLINNYESKLFDNYVKQNRASYTYFFCYTNHTVCNY